MTDTSVSFEKSGGNDILEFKDGKVSACCYSYYIDSYGDIILSSEETRELYEVMKAYYVENDE